MEKYPQLPPRLRQPEWHLEPVRHKPNETFPFHFHEVEEWVQVRDGDMSFFTAGELVGRPAKYTCVAGDVWCIPLGEVHRVTVGPDGVDYLMWTPVPSGSSFQRPINPDLEELIRRNLQLPEVENRYDQSKRSGTPLDPTDEKFLNDFVAGDLTMRGATGRLVLPASEYLNRDPAPFTRSPSRSVRILHRTPKEDSPSETPGQVLLSTVVHTEGGPAGSEQIVNLRLFVHDGKVWRCRIWVNYPEPGAS